MHALCILSSPTANAGVSQRPLLVTGTAPGAVGAKQSHAPWGSGAANLPTCTGSPGWAQPPSRPLPSQQPEVRGHPSVWLPAGPSWPLVTAHPAVARSFSSGDRAPEAQRAVPALALLPGRDGTPGPRAGPPARLCPEANLLLLQGVWPRALGTQRPLLLSTLLPLGATHTWTGTLSSVDTEPSVPAGGTAGPQNARRGWSCVRPQAPKSLTGTLG